MYLSTDNTVHGSHRGVEKAELYFKLKRQPKIMMVILHAMCSILKIQ